jgi:RNA polymerase sigma factor (sigma-70 family)
VSAERLFTENLPLIERTIGRVCARGRCSPEEREEFHSYSIAQFVEDDFAILRKYEGRCSLGTYLTHVIARQLIDFRRKNWGTWRTSATARKLGPAAEELDRLMYREKRGAEEAIDRVLASGRHDLTRDELRRLADLLRPHYSRSVEGDDALDDLADPGGGADRDVLARERGDRRSAARRALAAALAELGEEDRFILQARYKDGIQVPRIAHILGLEQKALYRRCERLLVQLRRSLEGRGIKAEDVLDFLGEDGPDDDDSGEDPR